MKVIRTFVAVLIAEDLKKNIAEVQDGIRTLAPDVKWVAPENLHVTLKFLGNVAEEDVSSVCDAVSEAVAGSRQFDLALRGIGAFPNPDRARVVWAGVDKGGDELAGLARFVEDRLAALGFEREDRPFRPHITIGRVKDRAPRELAVGIREVDAVDLGCQKVASVAVVRSDLRRSGPVYSPLCEIDLAGD